MSKITTNFGIFRQWIRYYVKIKQQQQQQITSKKNQPTNQSSKQEHHIGFFFRTPHTHQSININDSRNEEKTKLK